MESGALHVGHGEGQVSRQHPICSPPLASQRKWDSPGHAAYIARDTPLGHPQGLANEEAETRRGGKPRGLRGAGLIGHIAGAGLFRVERQLDDWPEKNRRETKWFDAHEAASLVDEGGLAEIIDRFADLLSNSLDFPNMNYATCAATF